MGVLPFANLSGDPAQDYLADALTDELTTGLARIHGAFVIARNTALTFKGKPVDAKTIGKDLGVRYVLEGAAFLTAFFLAPDFFAAFAMCCVPFIRLLCARTLRALQRRE